MYALYYNGLLHSTGYTLADALVLLATLNDPCLAMRWEPWD